MPIFAVLRKRGPGWKTSFPLEAQENWDGHASFMDTLATEGSVVLAGPLESTSEALIIMRADSPQEIEETLATDPWTRAGLLETTKIAEWTLRIGSLFQPIFGGPER